MIVWARVTLFSDWSYCICLFFVFCHSACRDPLGMESGTIPDSSLSVSSDLSDDPKGRQSRLNYPGNPHLALDIFLLTLIDFINDG